MATIGGVLTERRRARDVLSGTPRAHSVDRWIYVFTAVSFIVIVLAGFVPSSIEKIAAVQTGGRAPFPPVMHVHAVLMGSFLLLLLAQTTLVAMGHCALHRRLGVAAMIIAPAMIIAGFILASTNYHSLWDAAQAAPPEARAEMQQTLAFVENILLVQLRIGILFSFFLAIGLRARRSEPGLHKRMMILATAIALPAGIDRIPWLYSTLPGSPLSPDLYTLVAISPMFIWDLVRNRQVHRAYWIWLAVNLPFAVVVHSLWDTPWWHSTARQIMGV
jgi:hypothetical protein